MICIFSSDWTLSERIFPQRLLFNFFYSLKLYYTKTGSWMSAVTIDRKPLCFCLKRKRVQLVVSMKRRTFTWSSAIVSLKQIYLAVSIQCLLSVFCWSSWIHWTLHVRFGRQLTTWTFRMKNQKKIKENVSANTVSLWPKGVLDEGATVSLNTNTQSIRGPHRHPGQVAQRRPGRQSTETLREHWCCRRG